MAFKKTLATRLFSISRSTNPALTNCRISSPCTAAKSALLNQRSTPNKLAPDPVDDGIFRRYLHRQSFAKADSVRFLPSGEKLLEKLREMDISRNRIRLDGLISPPPTEVEGELTVKDAKKILRFSQLETVKSRLRQMEKDSVSYTEFLEICAKESSSVDLGFEFAEMLDQSGSVIVLGNNVFLRPEKVVKAIQGLMPMPLPHNNNDLRLKELQEMEKHKTYIDTKAKFLVRRELWCGLGCFVAQTAAFMRLTFWELSWDVMEPICFYVTSMYFMGCYVFFLRTSKEPSFEGFFRSRFETKQKWLMEAQNFDLKRYNELKKACYSDVAVRR
ncbi:hypothetical protein ACJIZ3_014812 [Penstemon smallii]|uniref:Calcium uniporter protein C-terminal domain-containing protein n=1 Tax=Penstemon smallii TaxID=265156 RepID=A0ABD3RKR4_9LAMI